MGALRPEMVDIAKAELRMTKRFLSKLRLVTDSLESDVEYYKGFIAANTPAPQTKGDEGE